MSWQLLWRSCEVLTEGPNQEEHRRLDTLVTLASRLSQNSIASAGVGAWY
jgi:hypothetical protein